MSANVDATADVTGAVILSACRTAIGTTGDDRPRRGAEEAWTRVTARGDREGSVAGAVTDACG